MRSGIGAVVQRLRLEIAGRIVEGGVDLLAGRKMLLRRCEIGGGLATKADFAEFPDSR
jgi:hypothetical protein